MKLLQAWKTKKAESEAERKRETEEKEAASKESKSAEAKAEEDQRKFEDARKVWPLNFFLFALPSSE